MKYPANFRAKNWACIFGSDAAPTDFLNMIDSWHVPAFLSPLHHGEPNQEGPEKNDHYHLMLMFKQAKTQKQAYELYSQLGGIPIEQIEICRDSISYAIDLIHRDNPAKEQFKPFQVTSFCGANYCFYTYSFICADRKVLKEIIDWCRSNQVNSYCDLICYAMKEKPEWFHVIMKRHNSEKVWKYLRFLQSTESADKKVNLKMGQQSPISDRE